MGQSQSTTTGDSGEEDAAPSGVTLAPELEADIFRDFQSRVLQDEWNEFGTSVVARRQDRQERLHSAAEQHQQHVQAAAAQHRMASLDASLDRLNATIADQTVALDYEATLLLARHQPKSTSVHNQNIASDIDKDSKPLPCLGQRAHWMDCQKKYGADSRPCNFYVTALEECVTQTIGQSVLLAAAASANPNSNAPSNSNSL